MVQLIVTNSESSPKKKMALLTQSPNNVYPALTNGIEDKKSHIKNTSYLDNPALVSVTKIKASSQPCSTFVANTTISKLNGNCESSSSSESEGSPRINETTSPPHKTSQNHPPKFKLLNRSCAVTTAPTHTNRIEDEEFVFDNEEVEEDTLTDQTASPEMSNAENKNNLTQEDTETNEPLLIDKDKRHFSTPVKHNSASASTTTTPSKHSIEYSSSPSSTSSSLNRENSLDYKDSTGVDLHEFMVKTLRENPRDRLMLLKLERDFTDFINDTHKTCYKYPPMTSYHRMLIHRVAAYFGLDHNVDSMGKSVVISKTPSSRVPEIRFQVFCSREYTDEEISAVPKSILLRASSSDDIGTPPRYESPIVIDARYGIEDKKSRSIEEREEDYLKAKERIFKNDSSIELGDDILSPDSSVRLSEIVSQNPDVALSEKESAIAAVAAATGRKANVNKRKNIASLQLGQMQQKQFAFGWQQNDSNASTPSETYAVSGYAMNPNYQIGSQVQTIDGYQSQPSPVAINTHTAQPLIGPDGNPTYYPTHYNSSGQQLAYVGPNGTATYVTQNAGGQYVPVYYMNNTSSQQHQQQQQQQQQQYYMMQHTPTGQLVYVPTQSGASNEQLSNPSNIVVSPQATQIQYQDFANQLSNMSLDHRRVSVSSEECSELKTQPSTPTSPVETSTLLDQTKQVDYSTQNKPFYYMPNGRIVRPPAVYQQQHQGAYPVQYVSSASRHGYPSYAPVNPTEQADANQYAHVTNLSQVPTVVQQVRMPSGVIQQQYVTPTLQQPTQSFGPRVAMQQQQQHYQAHLNNAAQKTRFVSGVLPNPGGSTGNPVYIPFNSANQHAGAMMMNTQYPHHLQQLQHVKHCADNSVKSASDTTFDNTILTPNGRMPSPQQRSMVQMQPAYHPVGYPYMPQSTQRYVASPMYNSQMVRPQHQRKFRTPRFTSNNLQIRISRPNSTSSDIDQKTVSHILEIYDFPEKVTSDADAIFDEIKSSGARILKINSSSSQTLPNGVVTNSSSTQQHQRPTILAIFKSATEAQQALETVSSPHYKLRVSQKSPTHFSGSDYPNNVVVAKQ